MIDAERENLVAESLSDFHDRLTRGESPSVEAYSESLGAAFSDLLDVVETERELQTLLEPQPEVRLPREFGPYTLLKELGRGAVGIVYEAEHRDLGRRQAVKVLRAGFDETPDALERFHREAKALASIRHPNIVEIYDAGEIEGRAYYAMALVEGRTLSQLLRDENPDPQSLCREIAGVADALHTLHERGTFHRDVKPSNIMVDTSGRMVLADFGLARAVGSASLTRSGQALGTPLYMSPEQMRGMNDDVDGRSDVYGLGATLYEILSGRKIFDATDVRVLLHKVLNEQPEDVRRIRPDLPEGAGRIVRKAIEKERSDRYDSAAAMRDDLLAFAEGRPVLGRPVSPLRHFARRHRGGILAAAAVLLAAFGVFLWKQSEPAMLHLGSLPVTRVSINGEVAAEAGYPPRDLEYRSGKHTLLFEREHFRSETVEVDLAPGESEPTNVRLEPLVPGGRVAQDILLADLGLQGNQDFTKAPTHRGGTGGSGSAEAALLPIGRVRLDDIATFYLLLGYDDPDSGFLVFWRITDGERELLHREPLKADDFLTVGVVPAAVQERLAPGDVVQWGFVDERDQGITGTFEVAPLSEELAADVTRLREMTAGFDPLTRGILEANVLLAGGRPMSAYLTVRRVAAPYGNDDATLLPWALMREAFLALDLGSSPWGQEAARETLAFSDEDQATVYGD